MNVVVTTYKGPTNYRGSRIIARGMGVKLTVPWDHTLGAEENHQAAADELVRYVEIRGAAGPLQRVRVGSGEVPGDKASDAHAYLFRGEVRS